MTLCVKTLETRVAIIEDNQAKFCESLESKVIEDKMNTGKELTREEFKWFAEQWENSTGCKKQPDQT